MYQIMVSTIIKGKPSCGIAPGQENPNRRGRQGQTRGIKTGMATMMLVRLESWQTPQSFGIYRLKGLSYFFNVIGSAYIVQLTEVHS